jgi:hypothetical protein
MISGPSDLGWKQIGTWTANVSGSAGPFTYQWYKSFNGGSTWQTLGTSSIQTITMLDQSFLLRCDVHCSLTGQNASSTYYVEYGFAKPYAGLEPRPTNYALHQGYPNPFNPSTQIDFDLPEASNVSLIVYDALGRGVATLASGYHEAGSHTARWNAVGIASGVYFVRFTATKPSGEDAYSKINKLLLMK